MKVKKIFLSILLTVVCYSLTMAQQEANFTHYMHNLLSVNPAYAGTRNALTATLLHRNQWLGFEGAPNTYTITMHAPVIRENIGLGLSVLNDEIGPITTTGVFADFSYHVRLTRDSKLALGIKAGVNNMRGNLSSLILNDDRPDPVFSNDFESRFLPNFGFGFYFFTDIWYAGLSSPRLVTNDFFNNLIFGSPRIITEERHYFVILGSILNITHNIKLNPGTLIKATKGANLVADVSAIFIFDDRFEIGAMYRTGDAIGALVGFHFTEQLRFGYSYDWSVNNPTWRYNAGTHEVILRYDLIFRERGRRIISPRYF